MAAAQASNPSGRKVAVEARKRLQDQAFVERLSDHSRRRKKDLFSRNPHDLCGSAHCRPSHFGHRRGGAIGIAGVRDDRPADIAALLEMLNRDCHRRGANLVLREYSGGCGGNVGNHQRQVVIGILADPGVGGGETITKWCHSSGSPSFSPSARR